MCRRTVLGPSFGQPIEHLAVLPKVPGEETRFVAFACGEMVCFVSYMFLTSLDWIDAAAIERQS
jgi:hypothetical protein